MRLLAACFFKQLPSLFKSLLLVHLLALPCELLMLFQRAEQLHCCTSWTWSCLRAALTFRHHCCKHCSHSPQCWMTKRRRCGRATPSGCSSPPSSTSFIDNNTNCAILPLSVLPFGVAHGAGHPVVAVVVVERLQLAPGLSDCHLILLAVCAHTLHRSSLNVRIMCTEQEQVKRRMSSSREIQSPLSWMWCRPRSSQVRLPTTHTCIYVHICQ